jgi:hypothetical protein
MYPDESFETGPASSCLPGCANLRNLGVRGGLPLAWDSCNHPIKYFQHVLPFVFG